MPADEKKVFLPYTEKVKSEEYSTLVFIHVLKRQKFKERIEKFGGRDTCNTTSAFVKLVSCNWGTMA